MRHSPMVELRGASLTDGGAARYVTHRWWSCEVRHSPMVELRGRDVTGEMGVYS